MDPELKAYLDAQFAVVLVKLDEHGRKLDEHSRKLDEHDRRFDLLAEALVRIEHRLERARIA
jgi:hypothetical protein